MLQAVICSVKYELQTSQLQETLFLWLLFIFFVEIIKGSIVLQYKIRHVYSTIHQLCSNFHQLVKIFLTIYRLFFHAAVFMHPIFKSTGQILSTHIFLASEYFAVIDIQPPNNALFLRLMFSASPMHFKNVFIESDVSLNVNWHS